MTKKTPDDIMKTVSLTSVFAINPNFSASRKMDRGTISLNFLQNFYEETAKSIKMSQFLPGN